jgi:hypothetical protein
MNISIKKIATIASTSLLLASCEPKDAIPDLTVEHQSPIIGLSTISLPCPERTLATKQIHSHLTALGYTVKYEEGVLSGDLYRTENKGIFSRAQKALECFNLPTYLQSDTASYMRGVYALQMSTSAENLPRESREISIPRFVASWVGEHEMGQLEIVDQATSQVICVSSPIPTPEDLRAVENFLSNKKSPTPLPSYQAVEALSFTNKAPLEILRSLPESAVVHIRVAVPNLFPNMQGVSGYLIKLQAELIQSGKSLSSVSGIVDSFSVSLDVPVKPAMPPYEMDRYGNIVVYNFIRNQADQNGSGRLIVEWQCELPLLNRDTHIVNLGGAQGIDLSPLKRFLPQAEKAADQLTLNIQMPKNMEFLGINFISLLPGSLEQHLDIQVLGALANEVQGVQDLFGSTLDVVNTILLREADGLGSSSYFRPLHRPGIITLRADHVFSPDTQRVVVRHETIHAFDDFYKISSSSQFSSLFSRILSEDRAIIEKFVGVGDHPFDSQPELFETLIHAAIRGDYKRELFSPSEWRRLNSILSDFGSILGHYLPSEAPLLSHFNNRSVN